MTPVTRDSEGATQDNIYKDILREVVTQPVPHEGLVLPNSILRSHGIDAAELATQHDRLLHAFYAFVLGAHAVRHPGMVMLTRKQEDSA